MHAACLDHRIILDTITFITKWNILNKINNKLSIRSWLWKQDRQYMDKRNIDARSRNHCCSERAIIITYSEHFSVALVIQHATRMRCTILSSVACLDLPYFSTLPHKRHVLRENVIEPKMCVFIFSTSFPETFPILRRTERDIIIHLHKPSCKGPVIFVIF